MLHKFKLGDTNKQRITANSVRSAGYVDTHNLHEQQYEILVGEL